FFQAEDGIRDDLVTGVQTCALPILAFNQTAGNTYGGRECCAAFQQASTSADVTTGTRTVKRCGFNVLPAAISSGGSLYGSTVEESGRAAWRGRRGRVQCDGLVKKSQ